MSSINRRDALKLAGGSALAVALAGCTDMLSGEDDEELEDADVPDEPIQMGAQTFLQGPAFVLSQDHEAAYQIAVDRINEAGGIAGREIELDLVDEGEGAIQNYERFVDQGKDIAFGVVSSGNSRAMAPVVEDNGLVNICPDGAAYQLFEEDVTDPHYFFRLNPPDAAEAIGAALDAVERLGEDNINTVAGVNQNYAWGQSQQRVFSAAIEVLADAEIVYEGFPEQGAEDYSTHIEQVNSEEPDVLFTSKWGGDLLLFMRQFVANNGFDNIDLLVGSIGSTIYSDIDRDEVESWGPTVMGGRTHVISHPDHSRWAPNRELEEDIIDGFGEDIMPVSGYFNSAYASVVWYATAAEKAVRALGYWPDQDELAEFLAGHSFWTPAGFHSSDVSLQNGRQAYANVHSGPVAWNEEKGWPDFEDVNTFTPVEVTPPPGVDVIEWIESW